MVTETQRTLSAATPLFPINNGTKTIFDVTNDGGFLMVVHTGVASGDYQHRINVVLNWFEELKQRVPGGR